MAANQTKGLFITFEGIDACGKSTQVELLHDFLSKNNISSICLRDPGATSISEAIRSLLLDNKNSAMSPWTELLLYEAARAQMVEESIRPALAENKVVICDRFYDSTSAYQGYARGLDLHIVEQANHIGSVDLTPDLTFVIDVAPEIAAARKQKLGEPADRMEAEGFVFQEKVRAGYLAIVEQHPNRVKLIDGSRSIAEIQQHIQSIVDDLLHRQA